MKNLSASFIRCSSQIKFDQFQDMKRKKLILSISEIMIISIVKLLNDQLLIDWIYIDRLDIQRFVYSIIWYTKSLLFVKWSIS